MSSNFRQIRNWKGVSCLRSCMQDMTHCKEAFGCDSHFSDERALKCVKNCTAKISIIDSYNCLMKERHGKTNGRVLERIWTSIKVCVAKYDKRENLWGKWLVTSRRRQTRAQSAEWTKLADDSLEHSITLLSKATYKDLQRYSNLYLVGVDLVWT